MSWIGNEFRDSAPERKHIDWVSLLVIVAAIAAFTVVGVVAGR